MSDNGSMSSKLLNQLNEIRNLPEITLEKLADGLQDEALLVICLISILPFLQPVPIPGLSSLLGFVVFMQGIGLMFLKKPILTKKMKSVTISKEKFELIYKSAEKFTKITKMISLYSHPWTNSRASHVICGFAIVLSAAFLSLPLPVPMSNFVPALSIALICVGLLEEDLFLVITGLSVTVVVIWMGFFSYHFLVEKFPILFS